MVPALLKKPAMLHAYNYVGNNPMNKIDPLGLYDDPGGNGYPAPVTPPDHSEYPLNPANWQPNPNGLICSAVCWTGTKLMCFGLGAGTAGTVGIVCSVVTTVACQTICPDPVKRSECPK